jgi:hypothetical protein
MLITLDFRSAAVGYQYVSHADADVSPITTPRRIRAAPSRVRGHAALVIHD